MALFSPRRAERRQSTSPVVGCRAARKTVGDKQSDTAPGAKPASVGPAADEMSRRPTGPGGGGGRERAGVACGKTGPHIKRYAILYHPVFKFYASLSGCRCRDTAFPEPPKNSAG